MSVIPTFKLWHYELRKNGRAARSHRQTGRRHARGAARLQGRGRPGALRHRRGIHARIRSHRRIPVDGAGRSLSPCRSSRRSPRRQPSVGKKRRGADASRPASTPISSCSRPIPPTTCAISPRCAAHSAAGSSSMHPGRRNKTRSMRRPGGKFRSPTSSSTTSNHACDYAVALLARRDFSIGGSQAEAERARLHRARLRGRRRSTWCR